MLCMISLLFYAGMFLLTVTAKDIHSARLPRVTAGKPAKQTFTYTVTDADGRVIERTHSCSALPKEMVDSGKVFTLQRNEENDFVYYYAQPLSFTVDTSLENEDYYAISSDTFLRTTVILTGYETLSAGDEVFLIKE